MTSIVLIFRLFDIIEEMVEEILPQKLSDEFFCQFVDIKNVAIGDKCEFVRSNERVL